MRRILTPLISVLVGLAFLLPVAIGLMQGRVIEIELIKPRTAKEALQQAYFKHFKQKDYQGAIEKYRWIVEKFPESEEAVEAQYRIGNIYQWDLVEPEKAIREYERLREMYPESDYAIAALIRIGESYGRSAQYEKAVSYFKQVIEKHPKGEYVSEAKINLAGMMLYELDKLDEAEKLYEEIIEEYPNTEYAAQALLNKIYIQQLQRRITNEEALKAYQQFIEQHKGYPRVLSYAQYLIGYTFSLQGKPRRAIIEFKKVLNYYLSDDTAAATKFALAKCYEKIGEEAKAEREYREIIDSYPNTRYAVSAFLEMGDRYRDRKEYYKAIDIYLRALSLMPDDSPLEGVVRSDIARCYFLAGELDKAILEQGKILEKIPLKERKGNVLFWLGFYQWKAGRYKEAVETFQKAQKYPDQVPYKWCQDLMLRCKQKLKEGEK
jgi:TolA-binding protein